jgi:hypothetical protein
MQQPNLLYTGVSRGKKLVVLVGQRKAIRARFGLEATFDYLVGEKLLNFVEAASRAPDFARELPRLVFEVRRMFAPDEIGTHLARIERAQQENEVEENDPLREDPTAVAERVRQFRLIKELLTATTLGTS